MYTRQKNRNKSKTQNTAHFSKGNIDKTLAVEDNRSETLSLFIMCPTAAVIILLKLNHTARNSCPAERAHQEQTCPQDIPED